MEDKTDQQPQETQEPSKTIKERRDEAGLNEAKPIEVMNVALSQADIQILMSGLELLNQKGASLEHSRYYISLSLKLQKALQTAT